MFGRAITPPFYHHPSFVTPPNTPCGCSNVLSHPMVYHTPLGPPASCTLSPGVHKVSYPPKDTTPGDNIFKSQILSLGCVVLCQLRYTTSTGRGQTRMYITRIDISPRIVWKSPTPPTGRSLIGWGSHIADPAPPRDDRVPSPVPRSFFTSEN